MSDFRALETRAGSDSWCRPVFWQPVEMLLSRKTASWGRSQQNPFRAAVSGTCWPQDRLFRHGLVQSNLCTLCKRAPGTVFHR
eukprot:1970596-Pyramimonas_sp.AAC.1